MDYFSLNGLSRLDVKWSRMYNIDPNFLIPRANPHYELIMVADGPVFIQVGQEKYTLKRRGLPALIALGGAFCLETWRRQLLLGSIHFRPAS